MVIYFSFSFLNYFSLKKIKELQFIMENNQAVLIKNILQSLYQLYLKGMT